MLHSEVSCNLDYIDSNARTFMLGNMQEIGKGKVISRGIGLNIKGNDSTKRTMKQTFHKIHTPFDSMEKSVEKYQAKNFVKNKQPDRSIFTYTNDTHQVNKETNYSRKSNFLPRPISKTNNTTNYSHANNYANINRTIDCLKRKSNDQSERFERAKMQTNRTMLIDQNQQKKDKNIKNHPKDSTTNKMFANKLKKIVGLKKTDFYKKKSLPYQINPKKPRLSRASANNDEQNKSISKIKKKSARKSTMAKINANSIRQPVSNFQKKYSTHLNKSPLKPNASRKNFESTFVQANNMKKRRSTVRNLKLDHSKKKGKSLSNNKPSLGRQRKLKVSTNGVLDLSGNAFTESQLEFALSSRINSTSLRVLILSHCELSNEGFVIVLGEILRSKAQIRKLDVSFNNLGVECLSTLQEFLKIYPMLEDVRIMNNFFITSEIQVKIKFLEITCNCRIRF